VGREGRPSGTIDFSHDTLNDLVVIRSRWTLDSSLEVSRWYHIQAGFFTTRFRERKDVILLNDAFDITLQVAELWGKYRARLHEVYFRLSARVGSTPRVELTTNTSGVRYAIRSVECASLEDAIAAIRASRDTGRGPAGGGVPPSHGPSTR